MTDFLIYDLKVAVLIAVFYMFYRLMLARETFHRVPFDAGSRDLPPCQPHRAACNSSGLVRPAALCHHNAPDGGDADAYD